MHLCLWENSEASRPHSMSTSTSKPVAQPEGLTQEIPVSLKDRNPYGSNACILQILGCAMNSLDSRLCAVMVPD